jgi:hypothetical protein
MKNIHIFIYAIVLATILQACSDGSDSPTSQKEKKKVMINGVEYTEWHGDGTEKRISEDSVQLTNWTFQCPSEFSYTVRPIYLEVSELDGTINKYSDEENNSLTYFQIGKRYDSRRTAIQKLTKNKGSDFSFTTNYEVDSLTGSWFLENTWSNSDNTYVVMHITSLPSDDDYYIIQGFKMDMTEKNSKYLWKIKDNVFESLKFKTVLKRE